MQQKFVKFCKGIRFLIFFLLLKFSLFLYSHSFFSFKIIHFRPFLFQKHMYMFINAKKSLFLLAARGGGQGHNRRVRKLCKFCLCTCSIREAAKKLVLLLMAGPLRPNLPPPSSLMAVGNLERWKKRLQKKLFFP